MVNWSFAPAVGVVLAAVIRYALAAADETVRLTPAPPVESEDRPPLYVTFKNAVSGVLATRMPPVPRPQERRVGNEVHTLTAAPVLSVTVGTAPLGEVPSPLKVRVLSPLKFTVFPN